MGEPVSIRAIGRQSIALVSGWAGDGYAAFERQLGADLGVVLPEVGRVVEGKDVCVAGFGRGQYLLLAATMPQLNIGAGGVTSDLSHGRCGTRISGGQAAFVLNKGLAVDLSLMQFPVGSVAQSSIDHIGVWLFRRDDQTFDLYVATSYAQSFGEWLADAALEFFDVQDEI